MAKDLGNATLSPNYTVGELVFWNAVCYWRQGLACLLALGLAACGRVESRQPRLVPLPQDPLIQVYFNQSETSDYNDPYRQIVRLGDDLEETIVEAIAKAQSSIDVAVQELRLPKVAQALVERHQAGVQVRVILENSYSRPWSEFTPTEVAQLDPRTRQSYDEFILFADRDGDRLLSTDETNQSDALKILHNANVPWIDDTADGSKGSGLMHHKFAIIDRQTVIVTSANFTLSDIHGDFTRPESRGNANNLLKIQSYELANLFTQEFNLMWGDGPGGQPDSLFGLKKPLRQPAKMQVGNSLIAVYFSPTSQRVDWEQTGNGLIDQTLKVAKTSVDLALFVFSEQKLVNTLALNHQQGVKIRALIDPSFAYRSYSEALDMLGVALSENCQYEADNQPWQTPIQTVGVPILPPGDKLHHKFGVVDEKIAIAGSHNWSQAANIINDETLLVIENPGVAAHFIREFNRLYAHSQLGIPAAIERKIQAEQQKCSQVKPAQNNVTPSVINLNTATPAELESLPGIGPKLAQEIIKTRQQQPFTSLQDLSRVSGIGPKLLERLENRVTW